MFSCSAGGAARATSSRALIRQCLVPAAVVGSWHRAGLRRAQPARRAGSGGSWQQRRRAPLPAHSGPDRLDPDVPGPGADLRLPQPRKPSGLEPSYWLGREGAVEAQLKALQHNNFPSLDHGIETLYKFAGFSPWDRSDYFGVSLDLGQFERFRRIFYTPYYVTLLNLSSWEVLSSLEVSDSQWVARVHVVNGYRKEERNYSFYMEQRCGGKYDGVWYCNKLLAEGCTAKTLYGVI